MSKTLIRPQFDDISSTAEKLLKASVSTFDSCMEYFPLTSEQQLERFFPVELISAHRHPHFKELSESDVIKLSQLELRNFFSLTIHGESYLIENFEKVSHLPMPTNVASYFKKFIEEEEIHSFWFKKFCDSQSYELYSDKNITLSTFSADQLRIEELIIFFVRVFLFEQVSLVYNLKISKDREIPDLIREINHQHVIDEGRHLNFDLKVLGTLIQSSDLGKSSLRSLITDEISRYKEMLFNQFFNDEVYRDFGFPNALKLKKELLKTPEYSGWFSEICENSCKPILKAVS